jgi:hypothetical protein
MALIIGMIKVDLSESLRKVSPFANQKEKKMRANAMQPHFYS